MFEPINASELSSLALGFNGVALLLVMLQLPAVLILLSRLLQGPTRQPPLLPQPDSNVSASDTVSVVVPTLNEAQRIGPCLAGLTLQSDAVREILVVDSCSTDGTTDVVLAAQAQDPRIQLLQDDPLPAGWIGRPWALHTGFLQSAPESTWILGIDADTQPHPALVGTLIEAAAAAKYDLVSLAPRFILKSPGEWWLQPALLMTLVYRFGPAGGRNGAAERTMANGQCFLVRRELLVELGGYTAAKNSFCDDVTLARYATQQGAKVGFWDGSSLLKVRMYEGMAETWREWGRSLDLKDAANLAQSLGDIGFLLAVQALPWLLLPLVLAIALAGVPFALPLWFLGWLNLGLIMTRFGLQAAVRQSYDFSAAKVLEQWAFWLSPFADPLATLRIILSTVRRPTQWRGRYYPAPSAPISLPSLPSRR